MSKKKSSYNQLEDLIAGCKKNDSSSQRKIYELLYGKMMSVCLRYSSNRDEAADILQDGFIKVFEKIKLYSEDGIFEGWVRRIIVNTAIDAIRKKKNEFLAEDVSVYQRHEPEDDKQSSIYSDLNVNDVVEAMQKLSPMYRAVFNLYVMEGLTHQEISDELGISVGTSKSNFSKAKANIKVMLTKKLNGHEG